jgi:type IX secretion system PorP/SprF family membrane protein
LSFGVKGTANLFAIEKDKLSPSVTADQVYQELSSSNFFSPNVGAGVYFHSNKTYVGLSVPNFLETKRFSGVNSTFYKERMNYYFIAGHVFDLSSSVKFKPALLTKVVQGAPLQLDVSGNFMFFDKLVLGVAWRWDAAMSGMAGFQVNKGLYIGYAYDRETTKLVNYNSGSHEIFLRYELFKKPERIVSPRFF